MQFNQQAINKYLSQCLDLICKLYSHTTFIECSIIPQLVGSSIVFQDDAMVMLLYWKKCLLLVGERKFYGHVTMKVSLIMSERCYWMTASLYRKYNIFSDRENEHQHRTK